MYSSVEIQNTRQVYKYCFPLMFFPFHRAEWKFYRVERMFHLSECPFHWAEQKTNRVIVTFFPYKPNRNTSERIVKRSRKSIRKKTEKKDGKLLLFNGKVITLNRNLLKINLIDYALQREQDK